jgi:hypothetical protein
MRTPDGSTPQRYYLTIDGRSGDILCAHQEYVVDRLDRDGEGRLRPSDAADEDAVLNVAIKASASAREARDRLRVVRVECPPTIDFSLHRVELERDTLVRVETTEPQRTESSLTRHANGGRS